MLDDEVRIRPAAPEDAEVLTDVAWQSKGYWEYPVDVMNEFREVLTITEDFIEHNPTYILENEETEEILGFYALEQRSGEWWLEHLWITPEHIGEGLGGELFLHACETAETVGAEVLKIESEPNAEEFYTHMGAERIGDMTYKAGHIDRTVPVLKMPL